MADVKDLELRITQLENQLKNFQEAATPQALSKEEIAAYHKVSSVLAGFDDWGCGINECRPIVRVCVCGGVRACRVCRVCINECVCGPCSFGGAGGGFTGFGG